MSYEEVNPQDWGNIENALQNEAEMIAAATELASLGIPVIDAHDITPGDGHFSGVELLQHSLRIQQCRVDDTLLKLEYGRKLYETVGTGEVKRAVLNLEFSKSYKTHKADRLKALIGRQELVEKYVIYKKKLELIKDGSTALNPNTALEGFVRDIATIELLDDDHATSCVTLAFQMAQTLGSTLVFGDILDLAEQCRTDTQSKREKIEDLVSGLLKELARGLREDIPFDLGKNLAVNHNARQYREDLCTALRNYITSRVTGNLPDFMTGLLRSQIVNNVIVSSLIEEAADRNSCRFLDRLEKESL